MTTVITPEMEARWKENQERDLRNLKHMVAVISATTGRPYVVKRVSWHQYKIVDESAGDYEAPQLGGVHTYGVWDKIMGVALSVARDSRGYSIDELNRERKRLGL